MRRMDRTARGICSGGDRAAQVANCRHDSSYFGQSGVRNQLYQGEAGLAPGRPHFHPLQGRARTGACTPPYGRAVQLPVVPRALLWLFSMAVTDCGAFDVTLSTLPSPPPFLQAGTMALAWYISQGYSGKDALTFVRTKRKVISTVPLEYAVIHSLIAKYSDGALSPATEGKGGAKHGEEL